MTITSTEQCPSTESTAPAELLIKEAREASRRRRRRWFTNSVVIALVTLLLVALAVEIAKPASRIGNGKNYAKGSALAVSPCTAAVVSISNGPYVGGAQEEDAHSLTITNTGATPCLMSGFPRLVVYGPTGSVIRFSLVHHATGGYAMTSKLPKPFALTPHTSAYVFFAQTACMVGTETTTSKVALILPKTLRPSKPLNLLNPIAHCVGQSASYANPIAISPIEPTVRATEDIRP
jgi:hypothetical protein